MLLAEKHIIDSNHSLYSECDRLCFLSKNLFNASTYSIRQHYDIDKTYLNYHTLSKNFSENNNPDYRALPAKVSQQIMMIVDRNHKSFFALLKSYNKTPNKFKAKPELPRYKHKTKGRNILVYTCQSISYKIAGYIKLSNTDIIIQTNKKNIKQVRIVPMKGRYKIEVVYEQKELTKLEDNNGSYCGIDIGLNNLFAVAFNDKHNRNILVNGRPLKGINQYYNKKKAKIQSELAIKNKYTNKDKEIQERKSSKRLLKLTNKRNNKIDDYVHKSTCKLVKELKQTNVSKVVIGKNQEQKQDINLGTKNNQNFVSIPHARIIDTLKYKLELNGFEVIIREESYTSKCSAYDNETIGFNESYLGKRIKRGLFKTKDKLLINADINGACNILRKELPNSFNDNGIEGVLVHPKMLHIER